jgi:hypothetical protein
LVISHLNIFELIVHQAAPVRKGLGPEGY